MKHLGVYTIVSIMLIAVLGGFTVPEKGYASQPQITQADYESLKGLGDDAKFYAETVPVEGFGQDYLLSFGKQIFDTAVSLTPVNVLLKISKTKVEGVDGSYFKDAYLKILSDTYSAKKDIPGSTKNSVSLSALTKYNTFLGDILLSQAISTSAGNRAATIQEQQQAYIVWQFIKTRQAVALANVQLENGQITQDQKNVAVANANNSTANATIGAAKAIKANTPDKGLTCDLSSWSIPGCLYSALSWFIKSVLLEFAGFLLWAAANLLNYAMYHGVFFFKAFAPDGIYAVWTIVKQIVTLFVFFAGLFVGFMAIIGRSEDFKRYIVFLVFFGLFVNFSYPLVRLPIDLTNIVSLQIYQTTLGGEILASDSPNSNQTAGARIMAKMGLQNLIMSATAVADDKNNQFDDKITSLPGALAAVVFVGLAAYTLFMAAVLLIVRTALLVILIVASPLMLLDTVVPALGEKAQWLRGVFLSQLFVAPVFTIMLALTLKFLDIFSTTKDNPLNNAGDTLGAAAQASSVVVFFNLIIMITMLFVMLKVTKATAGSIGETVTKWAGKAGGLGTGVALGAGAATLGFAGRQGIGRTANFLSEKVTGGGLGSELLKKGLQGVGGAKYDLRNLSGVSATAGALGISGMGQGAKKGVKETDKESNEANVEFAKNITDDEEREKFLQRKFNNSVSNKVFNGGQPSKVYKNFVREDEKLVKQYASANEAERKEMKEDDKNKRFMQRFAKVEDFEKETDQNKKNQLLAQMSPEMQKAVQEKETKKRADKTRDEERVASYASADQATRESILRGAQNNPELLKNLNLMEQMRQVDNTANDAVQKKTELLKQLNNDELAKKVIAQDTHKGLSETDAINQKRSMYEEYEKTIQARVPTYQTQPAPAQPQLKQEYDDAVAKSATTGAIKQAQLQAAQTQAQAAQAITNAMQNQAQQQAQSQQQVLAQMAKQNDDLLDTLQKIFTNGPSKTPAGSSTIPLAQTPDQDNSAVKAPEEVNV